jgi:hypothetical protein
VLLAGCAVAWVGVIAAEDARTVRGVRENLAPADADPGTDLAIARSALERLRSLQDGPRWRHLWIHTLGRDAFLGAVREVRDSLARAEQRIAARDENRAWLASIATDAEQATTLERVADLQRTLMRGGPQPGAPLPVGAIADVQRRLDALSARLQEDDAHNVAALEAARGALADPATTLDALHGLAQLDLPRRDARTPARETEAAAVRAAARARRDQMLGARVAALEEEALRSPSAAQASVALVALERDPDIRRAGGTLAAVARARERIAARRDALAAWERGRRRLEERLAAGDPAGAAHALASLTPLDEERAREAGALRVGFPGRAAYALARGVVERAERGDWTGAWRILHAAAHDPALHAVLDSAAIAQAVRAAAALGPSEDRALYEAFRASRSPGLAARYLEGWPARPRRMAPFVRAYGAWLEAPVTALELTGVEWDVVGSHRSPVPDLPDATVEVWVEGGPSLRVEIEDIADGGRTTFASPPRLLVHGPLDAPMRIGAVARIALRTGAGDGPIAIGSATLTPADARAVRTIAVAVVDPRWSARPHRLLLRAVPVGAPPLPPWPVTAPAPSPVPDRTRTEGVR